MREKIRLRGEKTSETRKGDLQVEQNAEWCNSKNSLTRLMLLNGSMHVGLRRSMSWRTELEKAEAEVRNLEGFDGNEKGSIGTTLHQKQRNNKTNKKGRRGRSEIEGKEERASQVATDLWQAPRSCQGHCRPPLAGGGPGGNGEEAPKYLTSFLGVGVLTSGTSAP
jgi:hypothetical protein